jgi:hypothetical protein
MDGTCSDHVEDEKCIQQRNQVSTDKTILQDVIVGGRKLSKEAVRKYVWLITDQTKHHQSSSLLTWKTYL